MLYPGRINCRLYRSINPLSSSVSQIPQQPQLMEVLYLIPSSDSPEALAAVELEENAPYVQTRSVQISRYNRRSKKCFVISITKNAVDDNPWLFRFQSWHGSDTNIYLPSLPGRRISFRIGYSAYGGYGEASEENNLILCEVCGDGVDVLDPIGTSNGEHVLEHISSEPRYINRMKVLSFQNYVFEVQYCNYGAPVQQATFKQLVKRLSHLAPSGQLRRRWKDTGEFLGSGSFGVVQKQRDMRTGLLVACKQQAIPAHKTKTLERAESEIFAMKSISHVRML